MNSINAIDSESLQYKVEAKQKHREKHDRSKKMDSAEEMKTNIEMMDCNIYLSSLDKIIAHNASLNKKKKAKKA